MQKTDGRIQADGFERGTHIMNQQGVEERKKRVHIVQGWSAASLAKKEILFLKSKHKFSGQMRLTWNNWNR